MILLCPMMNIYVHVSHFHVILKKKKKCSFFLFAQSHTNKIHMNSAQRVIGVITSNTMGQRCV